ncbi:MAG TPA: DNA topoisomerase IB [Chitinophagaceae bacterium]|nr:DNA topoisomerase IB [Chitinophagaceae bacterium]
METLVDFKISKRKLKGLLQDAKKSAEVIDLVYVSDKDPGIERVKQGERFVYLKNGKQITDKKELLRIEQLVIPPAWENVWICGLENGHLQATGVDTKKRKQYLYHSAWCNFRNQTKFYQLLAFGKKLPSIREQLEKDLSRPGLPVEKVLAAVVMIMQQTSIRVGNNMYERLYGSFGLTTLKDKHVKVNGSTIKFCFKGKKGVYHEIDLKSVKLARIVKQCKDIPGKELFQYYDEQGERRSLDSGMVNEYIKNICCDNFTTKDFRTWTGTVYAIEAFKELGCCESEAEAKKKTVQALDIVARRLGNTRTICRKYYVHPVILDLYANSGLQEFIQGEKIKPIDGLSDVESILMNILESTK